MRGILFVFVFLIVAAVATVSAWLLLHEDRHTIVAEVPSDYLNTSDTSRFSTYPISLARDNKSDSVLVMFPMKQENDLNVSVLVYDSLQYAELMYGNRSARPLESATRLSRLLQKPLVNLSRLPDGSYFARLSSCNYGGFIHIRLTTSPERH